MKEINVKRIEQLLNSLGKVEKTIYSVEENCDAFILNSTKEFEKASRIYQNEKEDYSLVCAKYIRNANQSKIKDIVILQNLTNGKLEVFGSDEFDEIVGLNLEEFANFNTLVWDGDKNRIKYLDYELEFAKNGTTFENSHYDETSTIATEVCSEM